METKQSMDCVLKNPDAAPKPIVPKLIVVNPLNIVIEPNAGQHVKTLELKNIYPCRVAFRIQTNGPTRYTVCPNKGFLSIGEKSMVRITVMDGSKYQSNHQFMVQARPAPGDFADRKLIWKQPNILGIQTNLRVRTMRTGGQSLSKSHSKSPSSAHSTPTEVLTTPGVPSWTKTSLDHGEHGENIDSLATQVRAAIAEKKVHASEMIAVVNQIKSLEVELDRQTQIVNELSERVKTGELEYSNLIVLERSLKADIERAKSDDAGSPTL